MSKDNRTSSEKAADDFKGQQKAREDKVKLMNRAADILEKARSEREAGLMHFTESGLELLTIDDVLAHCLAGHKVETEPIEEDKPLTVTKGTVLAEKKR